MGQLDASFGPIFVLAVEVVVVVVMGFETRRLEPHPAATGVVVLTVVVDDVDIDVVDVPRPYLESDGQTYTYMR